MMLGLEKVRHDSAFMTEIRLEGSDRKYLKPVFFSDNFFALLPGEKKRVVAEHPRQPYSWTIKAWNATTR